MSDQPSRKRKRTTTNTPVQTPDAKNTSVSNSTEASPPAQVTTTTHSEKDAAKMGKYHCNYCSRDISNEIRIKCAKCPDFDLCVDCFYVGVETSDHKSNHPYRVMDDMSAPLYTSEWGADEELLLLEGIELFGLGNWVDIAEHVGTKNKFQCEYHYWTTYVDTDTFPLPNNNKPIQQDKVITEPDVKKDDRGLLVSVVGKENAVFFMPEEEKKKQEYMKSQKLPPGQEIGYLYLRGDYDVEYANTAEEVLGDMEITDEDSKEEREMKLNLLRLYDYKLTERDNRKKFAYERGFIDWKRIQGIEKKRSKEDREILKKYRCFARFVTQEKFDEFAEGLLAENRTRKRIELLKMYRTNGITTKAKAEQYELDKKKHDTDVDNRKRAGYPYQSKTPRPSRFRSSNYDEPETPMSAPTPNMIPQKRISRSGVFEGNPLLAQNELATQQGYELLSLNEREVCLQLGLYPKQYMLMKDVLLRENYRLGFLTKTTACKLLENFDKSKSAKLYDFFAYNGWVQPQASTLLL